MVLGGGAVVLAGVVVRCTGAVVPGVAAWEVFVAEGLADADGFADGAASFVGCAARVPASFPPAARPAAWTAGGVFAGVLGEASAAATAPVAPSAPVDIATVTVPITRVPRRRRDTEGRMP